MLTRDRGCLFYRDDDSAPAASVELQDHGYTVLRGVLSPAEIETAAAEINEVYDRYDPDGRGASYRIPEVDHDFRYEMFNRSPVCQKLVANREILDVIEPLLGEDCHIIANTCWRNPPRDEPGHGGGFWHIDAGPHVPLGEDQTWPEDIPHPVFAIGTHIFLQDCPRECGPTGVIPGSHKSGQVPPRDRVDDVTLSWNGVEVLPLLAQAGDVAMFVSDVWHRRLPVQPGDSGRFFLQVHYARRDIAQRVRTTETVNHVSAEARARIDGEREAMLLGIHPPRFYDG